MSAPKRADAASLAPSLLLTAAGLLLIRLGHWLRTVDDNLVDLGEDS